MSTEIENITIKDATHYIWCCHCIGNSRKDYTMKCLPLSKTKSGKVKVLVFGDRYWKNKDDIKKIRYVENYKLNPITKSTI